VRILLARASLVPQHAGGRSAQGSGLMGTPAAGISGYCGGKHLRPGTAAAGLYSLASSVQAFSGVAQSSIAPYSDAAQVLYWQLGHRSASATRC
jgi:hypothetical protein